jgi:hypothetical protein
VLPMLLLNSWAEAVILPQSPVEGGIADSHPCMALTFWFFFFFGFVRGLPV